MHAGFLHFKGFGGKGLGGLIPSCPQLHLFFVVLEEGEVIQVNYSVS